MQVTGIAVYPIKATAAIELSAAEVLPRGLAGDRRWMVVDQNGQFLHQRIHPQLALVRTTLGVDALTVEAPGMPRLQVVPPAGGQRADVVVWNDSVSAADAGDDAAAWFSQCLSLPCRLVFMDDAASRPVAEEYGEAGDEVSFADGLPLLLATEASLADLNRRLKVPLPMNRFRPNLVIDGDQPWVEESWRSVRVGEVEFQVTHPCLRCVVTTVDQQQGREDWRRRAAENAGQLP